MQYDQHGGSPFYAVIIILVSFPVLFPTARIVTDKHTHTFRESKIPISVMIAWVDLLERMTIPIENATAAAVTAPKSIG